MSRPAFHLAAEADGRTARRFPATLLVAIAGIQIRGDSRVYLYGVQAAALGFPRLTALQLTLERTRASKPVIFGVSLAGIGLLVGLFVLAKAGPEDRTWVRCIQLALGFHLLVAWLPFALAGGATGFWQFNRALFQRFLLAALYSAVLLLGLSIALVSINRLLGIDVGNDTYPGLFAVVSLLFNTWFFLAGVPEDWAELERTTEYPRALKVFAQYVLHQCPPRAASRSTGTSGFFPPGTCSTQRPSTSTATPIT